MRGAALVRLARRGWSGMTRRIRRSFLIHAPGRIIHF
jgi:hypothetical protein